MTVLLGADLGVADASTDDIYAAMDWLAGQQNDIEAKLARRHLAPEPNPARMALFDLSSSWLEGTRCPLAARGYSRDGKKGRLQIEELLSRPVDQDLLGGGEWGVLVRSFDEFAVDEGLAGAD